jgi:hypothetical protein
MSTAQHTPGEWEAHAGVGKRKPAEGASMTEADIDNIDCNKIRQVFRLAILVPKAKRNKGKE